MHFLFACVCGKFSDVFFLMSAPFRKLSALVDTCQGKGDCLRQASIRYLNSAPGKLTDDLLGIQNMMLLFK